MSFARRSRVKLAARDVLQFAPPAVWLDVIRRTAGKFSPPSANEGVQFVRTSRDAEPSGMQLPDTLRAGGLSDEAASVMVAAH